MPLLERMLEIVQHLQQGSDDAFLLVRHRIANLLGHTLLEVRKVGTDTL